MPSSFVQILPGAPTQSLQSLTTFTFRWKRYIVYISGKQLNILRSPTELLQAIQFDEELVAVKPEDDQGARIAAASAVNVWVLEAHTDNWNHVTWRKVLLLKREDGSDETRSLSWGNDGELLVGGSKLLSLFSVLIGYSVVKCLYNISPLHPLSKYPGPRLWRATRLCASYHHAAGDLYQQIAAIHEKYGPTVRIAPDELSFTAPAAWSQRYGRRASVPPVLKMRATARRRCEMDTIGYSQHQPDDVAQDHTARDFNLLYTW